MHRIDSYRVGDEGITLFCRVDCSADSYGELGGMAGRFLRRELGWYGIAAEISVNLKMAGHQIRVSSSVGVGQDIIEEVSNAFSGFFLTSFARARLGMSFEPMRFELAFVEGVELADGRLMVFHFTGSDVDPMRSAYDFLYNRLAEQGMVIVNEGNGKFSFGDNPDWEQINAACAALREEAQAMRRISRDMRGWGVEEISMQLDGERKGFVSLAITPGGEPARRAAEFLGEMLFPKGIFIIGGQDIEDRLVVTLGCNPRLSQGGFYTKVTEDGPGRGYYSYRDVERGMEVKAFFLVEELCKTCCAFMGAGFLETSDFRVFPSVEGEEEARRYIKAVRKESRTVFQGPNRTHSLVIEFVPGATEDDRKAVIQWVENVLGRHSYPFDALVWRGVDGNEDAIRCQLIDLYLDREPILNPYAERVAQALAGYMNGGQETAVAVPGRAAARVRA